MSYLLPNQVLRHIVSILSRQSSHYLVNRKSLRDLDRQIFALLNAVGATVRNDEHSRAFREAVAAIPSAYEMAETFRKIAAAPNPLSADLCSSSALVELNNLAREQWAERLKRDPLNRPHHLIRVDWHVLPQWQQESVRDIARELETSHRDRVKKGAPEKGSQNALIKDLADIFLSATKQDIGWRELPHAVRSYFIQFVHAVAAPFFPHTEVSPKALSNRWREFKKATEKKRVTLRHRSPKIRKRPSRLKS